MTLIEFLAQSYYCIVVMIASTLAALVVSIMYYGRHRNLRIFTYYIAFSLIEDVAGLFECTNLGNRPVVLTGIIITDLFMFFEFIVVQLFILQYIVSPVRKRIIRINIFLFPVLMSYILTVTYPIGLYEPFFLLAFVFLIPPCLFYFYELFQKVSLQPLKDQPAFWIVTAFLFHCACTIPYGLTAYYLGKYQQAASSIVYILYCVVFLFIIKANLCPVKKRSVTTQAGKIPQL